MAATSPEPDFFGLFQLSEGEAGFLGAVIGGVLGVMGAYFAARYTIKKTREQDQQRAAEEKKKAEQVKQDAKLDRYYKAIFLADSSLQPALVQMYGNVRLLRGCVKHIQEQAFTSSLPRPIVLDTAIMRDFQNLELVNKWLQLSMMIQRVNDIIDDFRAYYLSSTEAVHMLQLKVPTGGKLEEYMNANIVKIDYETIADFGQEAIEKNQRLIEDTQGVLALIAHHAKKGNMGKFASVKDMNDYRIPLEEYEAEVSEVKKQFDPDELLEKPTVRP